MRQVDQFVTRKGSTCGSSEEAFICRWTAELGRFFVRPIGGGPR